MKEKSASTTTPDHGAAARAQAPEASGTMASGTIGRREALRRIGLLMGGAVSASSVAGVLSGCQAEQAADWTPQVFSDAQNEQVIAITERIIPETDTPGAAAAQVNRFIDKMLAEWHPQPYRQRFLDGLDAVGRRAQQRFGAPFAECTAEEQDQLLTALEQDADDDQRVPLTPSDSSGADAIAPEGESTQRATREGGDRGREESDDNILGDSLSTPGDSVAADPGAAEAGAPEVPPFFHIMKEQTLIGYYTSEIGMTQELQWNPTPGRYDGCVPLSEVGRAWA